MKHVPQMQLTCFTQSSFSNSFILAKPLPRVYTQTQQGKPTPKTSSHFQSSMDSMSSSSSTPTPPKSPQYYNNNNVRLSSSSSPRQYSTLEKQQRPSQPPPRIPSLMKPLKLNGKPIPPPKPKSKQQVADVLRREKNFELPVRVVYETFI